MQGGEQNVTNGSEQADRRRDRLLRIAEVRDRTGLSTATIYRREAKGTFPPRRPLGGNCVGWYESDVGNFVADPAGYRAPVSAEAA
ncbi:AlpA family phage regulatory protein [Sphingomonas desiccabilis]|uniref:AlpA family phage regulatory protein n=1 Tax=Sphingomonas desiccabilis TaxID=429134 RepID=A0A4Q2IXU5_9SPHN|nr:AlpA family phage regulatory protein [Sphingomonas desiccabilis]